MPQNNKIWWHHLPHCLEYIFEIFDQDNTWVSKNHSNKNSSFRLKTSFILGTLMSCQISFSKKIDNINKPRHCNNKK
jgi:hypothetical protein